MNLTKKLALAATAATLSAGTALADTTPEYISLAEATERGLDTNHSFCLAAETTGGVTPTQEQAVMATLLQAFDDSQVTESYVRVVGTTAIPACSSKGPSM